MIHKLEVDITYNDGHELEREFEEPDDLSEFFIDP
jgi:hypothetical protein